MKKEHSTYKFNPIPTASVATNTLQLFSGSLNFFAMATFVAERKIDIFALSVSSNAIKRIFTLWKRIWKRFSTFIATDYEYGKSHLEYCEVSI